ncbi:hypothetical protein SS50377_25392 [Spironucleus salmonicida]|uniref:Uncharacterized protein n=1 Tax=Spironucleus salmonicida TaxID=348837 RepID=V6LMK2_9EUKA|nr:hypothetical protein SS50377_25392 [Spironucleus salmonicida]|eukprot:EST44936.1 hypothetical protein SS50377_14954 [Spironucleus salmonicida]
MYIRPSTFVNRLYPPPPAVDFEIQKYQQNSNINRVGGTKVIFPPFSKLEQIGQIQAALYQALDPAQYNKILIFCSHQSEYLMQTPFTKWMIPTRECMVAKISQVQDIPFCSEFDCINNQQAEIQLIWLSRIFNLQRLEVYIFYCGNQLQLMNLPLLYDQNTLVICPLELTQIGIAFQFVPKRECGLMEHAQMLNQKLVVAMGQGIKAIIEVLKEVKLPEKNGFLTVLRFFKQLEIQFQYELLCQSASNEIFSALDSAKTFGAIVGFTSDYRSQDFYKKQAKIVKNDSFDCITYHLTRILWH